MILDTTHISYFFEKENPELHKVYTIHGWLRTYRKQSELYFFQINDGTTSESIQVIYDINNLQDKTEVETQDSEYIIQQLEKLNTGCYIKVSGILIESPAQGQKYELQLLLIHTVGHCDALKYPIKKNIKLDALREIAHFRGRTKVFGAVYRIRNTLFYETHNFFQSQKPNFLHLDPNIITINECEGGAGVFTVTELLSNTNNTRDIPNQNGKIKYSKDHFKQQAYLTVSSQLQLEALACGMGNVYTMNKSFRSEHSHTNKHVSEFTHLEIEMINIENDDLMDIGQAYIQHIINKVYEKHKDSDLKELNMFACKGILNRFELLKSLCFNRVSYKECIDVLQKNNHNINYGDDLSSEAEHFLTSYYDSALFVYNWPYSIKSFYMKQSRDCLNPDICENFDLLMPFGVGELIGGSMREHEYERLVNGMKMKDVNSKGLEWYLQLREFGSVEHGGFGLGIDRLLMMITGIQNIKDVIPFPVYYENCKF
jgi:asparaginyl-tRNA synthetase